MFVRSKTSQLRDCYELELKDNPALQGTVVMLFTITPAGGVSEVGIEENTFPTALVGACLQGMVEGWTFPFRPTDDTPVAYPFVFSPGQ